MNEKEEKKVGKMIDGNSSNCPPEHDMHLRSDDEPGDVHHLTHAVEHLRKMHPPSYHSVVSETLKGGNKIESEGPKARRSPR